MIHCSKSNTSQMARQSLAIILLLYHIHMLSCCIYALQKPIVSYTTFYIAQQ